MFDRFSKQARQVMNMAYKEAMRVHHQYIGTEHLLLGLINIGPGRAIDVLKSLKLEPQNIRLEVEKRLWTLTPSPMNPQLPQTPRAKNVVRCAIEEAQNLECTYVGTEHILFGLLREQGGIAAEVLNDLGLDLEKVRDEIRRLADAEEA